MKIKGNEVIFSDEFRLNFGSDNNRVLVWRSRGERFNRLHCTTAYHSHNWCDGMGSNRMRQTVTPNIDPFHHMTSKGTFITFSHICCHSWQGSQEPFFNRTMLRWTVYEFVRSGGAFTSTVK
ncbi:hypothetical protein TNCV_3238921 [Trichonephila clavipes]|nr:hypothetical protein TNCV_3238921 [Trichonephila clavipes]